MHHCSTKWATFLLGLPDLAEQGKGRPSPRDLEINLGDRGRPPSALSYPSPFAASRKASFSAGVPTDTRMQPWSPG